TRGKRRSNIFRADFFKPSRTPRVETRKEIAMKVLIFGILGLLLIAGLAEAQQTGADIEQESGSIFTSILHVVIKWVFPVCAAYCFLHGVIGKGVKRGE